jgi:hypothetical protein
VLTSFTPGPPPVANLPASTPRRSEEEEEVQEEAQALGLGGQEEVQEEEAALN